MTISGAQTLDDILRRNDTNFTTNTDKTFTLEVGLPSGKKKFILELDSSDTSTVARVRRSNPSPSRLKSVKWAFSDFYRQSNCSKLEAHFKTHNLSEYHVFYYPVKKSVAPIHQDEEDPFTGISSAQMSELYLSDVNAFSSSPNKRNSGSSSGSESELTRPVVTNPLFIDVTSEYVPKAHSRTGNTFELESVTSSTQDVNGCTLTRSDTREIKKGEDGNESSDSTINRILNHLEENLQNFEEIENLENTEITEI